MKRFLKSSLSIFLAITIIFSSAYVGLGEIDFSGIKFNNPFSVKSKATSVDDLDLIYGTDEGITRAEWLHNLVVVFDMTVEEESLPDNYFSDLTEEHEYYSDIILAVEFGVVNVEAGGELRPDDYVTRDFAASTLNFCLGYQLEEGAEYTFTDNESCSFPDSAQIAVDRGWLKLSGGCFAPDTLVTSDEAENMFKDAVNVLEESVVDTDYDSTFDFADDVIVVEKGTVVSEDENGVVSITDCPETISAGDKFAVYHGELPCVYVAETVKVENEITKITTSVAETEEAYTEVDAQGQADADAMELIPADDVEISFEEEANPVSTFATGSKTIKTINVKKTISLTNAAKATVSVKIKNPVVDYSVNKSYVYVALSGTTEINYGIKMDMLTATGTSKQIKLFTCNVAGVGSFDVNINLSCEGSASGNVTGYLTAGIECVKGDHIRAVKGFTQSQYYSNVEATANVGLRASLGVTHLPFVDASIYAEVGANARLSSTTYSGTELPKKCTHFSAYMYALYGAYASVDFGVWSKTFSKSYEIFGYSNSPVRIVHHYEDGMPVPKCTRGTSYENFFTNGYSHWSGSGWLGANGAYGLYGDGTCFPLYDYTLDENNNATITKYNGNSWSVYIPEDIDGYTVTTIGNSAFEDKNAQFINIPDTVTRIETEAFNECYYLNNIVIPNTVTYIGSSSFYDCLSLSDITIPTTLEIIDSSTFSGCSSLRSVIIPDSVTEIGWSAFSNCTNLKDVTLSKSLTTLEYGAFRNTVIESIEIPKSLDSCSQASPYNSSYTLDNVKYSDYTYGPFALCENLKTITFEKGTTQIAQSLFTGCVGLEKITIPDTVTVIESYAFEDCFRLKEVTIPNSVTEIQNSAFSRCVSLPNVAIPDSVTEIGSSAFSNCTTLKDVIIPDSVTIIGSNMFDGCSALETAKLSDNIDKITSYMFRNCTSLKSIDVLEKVKTIQNYAFYGCSSLKEATLPETLESIGSYAFQNCVALEKINIPKYVNSVGTQAFMGCEALATVDIADYSIQEIKTDTFKDCPGLTKIVLPKGLTKIGSQAFMNDTGLTEVVIPESVTSIDSTAFSYPAKTTIYGKAGSYAETFATEGGFKFQNNNVPVEGIILKDGVENITLDIGETYRAEFEVYPEDANDVVTLTSNNNNVTITLHDIYARYTGDTAITATATSGLSYEFNVHIRSVKNISITKQPTKLSYIMGESLDLSGMEVQVGYNDGSSKIVTDYTVSGFDSSAEGTSTVTVQWIAANGSKYTTTFDVEIVDPTPKVTGIFIEALPTKVQYELREKLDLTGMVVKANYTDGSVKEITDYTTSGFNALKNGAQVITVAYNGFTTTFTVYVGVVACEHSYGNWVVDKKATCTESGSRHKTCSRCGDVVTETISSIGHTSSDWMTDQEATVYKAGSKHKECTKCGEVLETKTIAQLKCAKPVLKKVYNANSYVKVTWGTVKGADKYYVYRKTGTGDYEYIGSTTNKYFNDKEASAGKTCRYIVKAKNEAGYSDASASLAVKHIDEPTLKSIENSAYGVLIKWNKVTGAEKYNVYRKVSGGEYKYIGATTNAYYTDKTAKSGTKYYYAIRAKRDDSISSQSASLSKYYLAVPILKTITNTEYGVKITWGKVTGAEKYNVYRKVSGGTYKYIGATSNTYYTDKTAKSGTKYYYEVRAKKGEPVSALSSSLSKYYLEDTTLQTPTSTTSGIKLSWSKVTGAEGYMVYRKTGSGSYSKIATVKGSTKVTYRDSSAQKGKKYTYKVKAYKSKTYSAYSNTKTITDKY